MNFSVLSFHNKRQSRLYGTVMVTYSALHKCYNREKYFYKTKALPKGSYHKAGFELPNKEKGVRTILFVLLFTRLACKV